MRSGLPGCRSWWSRVCSSFVGDLDDELAEVVAVEQLDQRVGEGLESLDNVLARPERAIGAPGCQRVGCLVVTGGVVARQESLHTRAVDQERHVVRWPLRRSSHVD